MEMFQSNSIFRIRKNLWKTPTLTLYDSYRRALVKVIWRFSANCSSLDIATRLLKLQNYFPSDPNSFHWSAKTTLTTIYQDVKHQHISMYIFWFILQIYITYFYCAISADKIEEFSSNYLEMTEEERKIIAHQPMDMIKSCKFGISSNNDTSCKDFRNNPQTIFSPSQGICYIFNFGPQGVGNTTTAGSTYGLQLEINIECKFDFTWKKTSSSFCVI